MKGAEQNMQKKTEKIINGITVHISGSEMPCDEELAAYVQRGLEKYGSRLNDLDLTLDGEFVDISYGVSPMPFDRIRRITGYLVGTLDRFNNGKRAEEHDRVKHGVEVTP